MLNRESELDAFKKVDMSLIASSFGFEKDQKRSTASTVMMSNGSNKIAISYNGRHFIYWHVHDEQSNGTVIDFIQTIIEPNCSLGRVRQLLRPFLNTGYVQTLRLKSKGNTIRPSETDFPGVAKRYAAFLPITQPHAYLCHARSIPFELLQSKRLYGRVRHCPQRNTILFPHFGCPAQTGSHERSLIGYEIKGPGTNMFSKGGKKALFISIGQKSDQRLAIGESGLDMLSYMALRGDNCTRIISLSGKMNPQQPKLIRSAIEWAEEGTQIIAAFDNDNAGDQLTEKLFNLVTAMGRGDLFLENRPEKRGADWNEVLMKKARNVQSLSLEFGG